ncbi:putative chaperonin alpha subunit [Trypanosoma cruzi]|uniref:T-complex protein 1 subunit alpha n=2 Tax=Trypanosoma cruzi TaxID=5693 RepID=Q4DD37_TRYCC|nr:chaperonin alpha subunit, putative [Trypanosoma cruzi]EAN90439.1 chaperonin alpha subunit, putative [Trypanosoma cruzi]PWV06106.1 putative chaperonin alpha subunit [Trypanosoma cruzi]|eukprot:XP_812290.1 chaperonin alpha subunit [Trypanosoma cruzi strain CL Brener]
MQTKQKQTLGINGSRTSGLSVRRENVTAAMAVANIVKSSLGPIGLDKMLVDDVGDVCVTNDGATILKSLDVEHPAARLLVDLAQLQDKEIGDGTTSVVILASELLKRAQDLIVQGIHATSIIAGYKLALREAVRFLKENLSLPVEGLGKDVLLNIARTSMSSKILSSDADLFAKIVVDAILSVKTVNELGDVVYPRKAVSVLLQHGKSSRESALMQGFALGLSRAAQGMPTSVQNARIALIDFDLRAVKMKLGINITITDPNKAEAIRQRELDITKERIKKMLAAGANVILTSWGIEDSMMKYMVDEGVLGVRRVKKDDMRRIAKVTGAQVVHTLSDLEGEEVFDPKWLGKAERVYEQRFGEDDVIIISGTSNAVCSSIICRGANYLVLEEMERALNDALWAVARTLEASRVLAGGGAVEVALSVYLENFAHTLGSREQLAIAAFSEALLVIPKTLALNAAMDATDLVARLRVLHNEQQAAGKSQGVERFFGLELIEGTLRNNVEAGVLEPQPSKIKSLHFATEAAITILRIDDCVRLNPEEEEERR